MIVPSFRAEFVAVPIGRGGFFVPGSLTITVRDQQPGGKRVHELALKFNTNEVTLRDIIAERVRMEIDLYEQKVVSSFANSLVQPTDAEARLNEAMKKKPYRPIDGDKQIEAAFAAFESNGFFVLVGDRQVDSLDTPIALAANPEISFIKLTPLVGG
jgi:hypothetical protein